jgi:hypothetical protein
MAFTSIGCISASPVFATQLWSAGSKTLGPVTVPDKINWGALIIDLTQITDLLGGISVSVDFSSDGVVFNNIGGYGLDLPTSGCTLAPGGVGLLNSAGIPVRTAWSSIRFPNGDLITRAVKGTVALTQPMTVGMTLVIW